MSLFLAGVSLFIYLLQNSTFHHPRDTVFYFFQDLAFIPVQIMLGVLVVDNLVRYREKKKLLNKMNMVIGVFFSEAGMELLSAMVAMTDKKESLTGLLHVDGTWNRKKFSAVTKTISGQNIDLAVTPSALAELKTFLTSKREAILRLLENPNLMEHDRFTDLLWAVSHCAEELEHRNDLSAISRQDSEHLKGDILRAYRLLVIEWLFYMDHLKGQYPYLFSLAVRTNPFNPDSKVEF